MSGGVTAVTREGHGGERKYCMGGGGVLVAMESLKQQRPSEGMVSR